MHRRVSQRAVHWDRVIHLRALRASGISSWYSCQTDRLQTICSKRRNSVFGALGPIRSCESNLKPWAMCSWSRQLNSIQNFRNLQRQLHRFFPPHGRDDYGQTAFCAPTMGTASEFLEVGDLSCPEIKPGRVIIGLFSHHGDRQSGRKRGAQAAIGQAPCKPSRLSGFYRRRTMNSSDYEIRAEHARLLRERCM
jgi:hypothetical protein